MPIDHPDGIAPISISRADIKTPIDIQKQTINVEIDIVAQTLAKIEINIASSSITLNINIAAAAAGVTLNVNVKSQTANINVNIAASAVTVNVNISSQTANINVNIAASAATITVSVTGTAQVNIYAQNVGIFLQPEWTAKEGTDKTFNAEGLNKTWGQYAAGDYSVGAGKIVYITSGSFSIVSNVQAEYNDYFYGLARIQRIVDATVTDKANWGGLGGGVVTFPKPIVFEGPCTLRYIIHNRSDKAADMWLTVAGYEE